MTDEKTKRKRLQSQLESLRRADSDPNHRWYLMDAAQADCARLAMRRQYERPSIDLADPDATDQFGNPWHQIYGTSPRNYDAYHGASTSRSEPDRRRSGAFLYDFPFITKEMKEKEEREKREREKHEREMEKGKGKNKKSHW